MFTFGIFSTHIPYVAFLFFYLTYFLVSGQTGKFKQKVEEVVFGKKEIVVDNNQHNDVDSFFFAADDSKDEIQTERKPAPIISSNLIILGPGDRINIACFFEQSGKIVNRPPPSYI